MGGGACALEARVWGRLGPLPEGTGMGMGMGWGHLGRKLCDIPSVAGWGSPGPLPLGWRVGWEEATGGGDMRGGCRVACRQNRSQPRAPRAPDPSCPSPPWRVPGCQRALYPAACPHPLAVMERGQSCSVCGGGVSGPPAPAPPVSPLDTAAPWDSWPFSAAEGREEEEVPRLRLPGWSEVVLGLECGRLSRALCECQCATSSPAQSWNSQLWKPCLPLRLCFGAFLICKRAL